MIPALFYFHKHDPELLKRRLESKEKESAQKIVIAVMGMSVISIYVLSGLDHRLAWSDVPISMQIVGFVLVAFGYIFTLIVMKQNSFAARTVRVEESQTLIDTGLYGSIRHPMYTGVFAMYGGTPIALGSWWALVPLAIFMVGIQFRMLNEEKVLGEELSGYKDYVQRVRWRLIPGIW